MSKNSIVIALSIVLGCAVLGGFYYVVQTSKLASAERQQLTKLNSEKEAKDASMKALTGCLDSANDKLDKMRKDYCKLDNREILPDGTCFLSKERVDYLNERKNQESDICFKKYPQ